MVHPIMENKYALRYILLHEYHLHGNATEAFRNITSAWGENTISVGTCREWFARFRSGDTSLEDMKAHGRPPVLDDEALKELVEEHPGQSERQMANSLGVSASTISRHLKNLNSESQ